MTVALTTGQQTAIRQAIVPVEMCPFATVKEACKAMGTVLPLVVGFAVLSLCSIVAAWRAESGGE